MEDDVVEFLEFITAQFCPLFATRQTKNRVYIYIKDGRKTIYRKLLSKTSYNNIKHYFSDYYYMSINEPKEVDIFLIPKNVVSDIIVKIEKSIRRKSRWIAEVESNDYRNMVS